MLLQFKPKHQDTPIYINVNKIIGLQEEASEKPYIKIYTQDRFDSYFTVEGKVEDIVLRINNYESVFEKATKNLIQEIKTLTEVIKRK